MNKQTNYYCKHCQVFVRDSKLERANHEATGKHQWALKRHLRDLHRTHQTEERERDRARREVDRLNGVPHTPSAAAASAAASAPAKATAYGAAVSAPPAITTDAETKQRLEQLAAMGVAIPDQFRGELAMAGEWTVTSERVVRGGAGDAEVAARAVGVRRKREPTEAERDEEEAVAGLFKKPRRWGRDSRALPAEDDGELDALLSGALGRPKREEGEVKLEEVKREEGRESGERVKREDEEHDGGGRQGAGPAAADGLSQGAVKPEPADEEESKIALADIPPAAGDGTEGGGTVLFKKRKPKNIRQK